MTVAPPPLSVRRSLRTRFVLTFAGLAVIPSLAALAGLFFLVRYDVGTLRGADMAQEAGLLAAQLEAQVEAAARSAAGIASLPDVRGHLAGERPYPLADLSAARRLVPGLRHLTLRAEATPDPRLSDIVTWGTDETFEVRVPIVGVEGVRAGTLEVSFDLERLHRVLEWYRRGEAGRAVLLGEGGRLLAGFADLPLPPLGRASRGWVSYRVGGETYFAGIAPVDPWGGGLPPAWHLAVIQPGAEVYASFYTVAGQIALVLGAFSLVVLALAWRMADQFLRPILRIHNGAEIISRINLAHRIQVDTGDELQALAEGFNRMAESLSGAYGELEGRVRETTRSLQEERNRLAAVLRTMAEGVVMGNEDGDVVLMNPAARVALCTGPSAGIGGPLCHLLPEARLEFYLRRLRSHSEGGRDAVEPVTFPLSQGPLLRGLLSAIPGPGGGRAGYLVVFRDTSARAQEERRLERAVREMPELLRGPTAAARSLLETLERHPDMPAERQKRFLDGIREEVSRLTDRLRLAEDAAEAGQTLLPGVPCDPSELLREAAASVSGAFVQIEDADERLPAVSVEPFSWVSALAALLRWAGARSSGWSPVRAALRWEDGAVVATFQVEGALGSGTAEIEELDAAPPGEAPASLAEVVRRNRGEVWTRVTEGGFEVRLALLPATEPAAEARVEGIADEQPEFYDFDLFLPRPSTEPAEMLRTSLANLEYVVFDSETTGLHPSQGDEVVSLSAVRVRHGKVQHADTFHSLVNPGRPIPRASIRFHGIEDAMVADAPGMAEVLPLFYEYVGGSVLVAHNAAFDKKFLDLAAGRFGLPLLENPILDTLFLSYGLHKDFEGHNLDAIAERLGIEMQGRHTSLGDARVTALIFLRLVPLLATRGIETLGQAKDFCDRMLLLRWQSSRF
ncbi:MAG: exonuclease domain-containing protein [Deferrisomatales bacterium]|nr:exonuclease domain-containing protein [Deferrisomatales bacterium]